jgi:hypothetical protein
MTDMSCSSAVTASYEEKSYQEDKTRTNEAKRDIIATKAATIQERRPP